MNFESVSHIVVTQCLLMQIGTKVYGWIFISFTYLNVFFETPKRRSVSRTSERACCYQVNCLYDSFLRGTCFPYWMTAFTYIT